MRLITIIILLLTTGINAGSQNFEWIRGRNINYDSNPEMLSYTVCTSPDGGIWQGGIKHFIEFYHEAMGNLFIARYDNEGNLTEDFEITGSASIRNLASDADGNLYISGQTLGDLLFWDGQQLEFSGPFIDGFLVKVLPTGAIDWVINLSELFPETVPEDIFVYQGHVYLAHSQWITSGVTEFDSNGNVIRTINQQSVSIVSGVALDAEGNIYVTGSCGDTQSEFGGVSYPTDFEYSLYLAKYNAQGQPLWVNYVEDITCTHPRIAIDGEGRIVWAGDLNFEAFFDTIFLAGPSWGYDFFLTLFNSNGSILWGMEVQEDNIGDMRLARNKPISIMPDNSITISGTTRGAVDWGNGVVSSVPLVNYEKLLLNISPDGNANWSKTGGGSGYDVTMAVDIDSDGNLYSSGVGNGTIQFDTCSWTGTSFYFPYITKLNMAISTNIPDIAVNQIFSIYPVPAKDELFIETSQLQTGVITIHNTSGQELMRTKVNAGITQIEVASLPAGIYFVKGTFGNGILTKRLVIN